MTYHTTYDDKIYQGFGGKSCLHLQGKTPLLLLLDQVSLDTINNKVLSPHNKHKKGPEREVPSKEDTKQSSFRTTVSKLRVPRRRLG